MTVRSQIRALFGTVAWVTLAWTGLTSCDDDGGDNQGGGGAGGDLSFACDATHDGWQQCTDHMVEWCHGEGSDPHFHWGANCEDLGFACVELSQTEAACVDTASACTPTDAQCEDNAAHNCLPDGHWAVEPCSGACEVHDGVAECEQLCSTTAPDDACAAMAATAEQSQVVETFSEVFSETYHAELGVPAEVTLPDNAPSYIHFPMTSTGELVVFLDTAEVFDAILDQSENDMLASGGTPNSVCPTTLLDHHHAVLTYSGSGDPVPYVLRFKAVPTVTVTFVLVQKCQ
ncbi:MAG: hypothetical protein JRI68_14190 [Deltaproteobacteria bacterium]|nr:hypothetical protein [Deltaproteobacteria bacterium]